jgi:hypothetical protein
MDMLIEFIGKLSFLKGYRTKIGLGATLLGYFLQWVLSAETLAAWPKFAALAHFATVAGPILAIIGARWKDDPKP